MVLNIGRKSSSARCSRFFTVDRPASQSQPVSNWSWTSLVGRRMKNCILLLHSLHYCPHMLPGGAIEVQWQCRQAAGPRESERGSAVPCCNLPSMSEPSSPVGTEYTAYMHASGQVRTYQHMGSILMLPVFDDAAKSVGGE